MLNDCYSNYIKVELAANNNVIVPLELSVTYSAWNSVLLYCTVLYPHNGGGGGGILQYFLYVNYTSSHLFSTATCLVQPPV